MLKSMVKRRISQLVSLLLLHSSWWPQAQVKWLCTPVLSCHSCALAWFACPVGVFVHYSGYHLFPYLALGTVLMAGALLGRLFCGWVCPFGFVQDLLYKIPGPKFRLPAWTAWLKYVVLGAMVVLIPFALGAETWFSFCRICPAAALQVSIPGLFKGSVHLANPAVLARFGFLALFLGLAVVSRRSFCKAACPIGALLAPLNYFSLWAIKRPTERCVDCHQCDRLCTMQGSPSARVQAHIPANRQPECTVCHECQQACPIATRS